MQRVLGFSAVITGLSLVPSTATVVLTSTFATRRLLERLGVKRMLLIGLASMGVGQVWLSFMTSGGLRRQRVARTAADRPGNSSGPPSCVDRREQGLAGGLLTTGQQMGSAVGLALLATIAAAHTGQTGSLAAGYGFSYLVATGIVLIAMVLVATQLNHKACQSELARQRKEAAQTRTDALLRKG